MRLSLPAMKSVMNARSPHSTGLASQTNEPDRRVADSVNTKPTSNLTNVNLLVADELIFRPLFRPDRSRMTDGTGTDLSESPVSSEYLAVSQYLTDEIVNSVHATSAHDALNKLAVKHRIPTRWLIRRSGPDDLPSFEARVMHGGHTSRAFGGQKMDALQLASARAICHEHAASVEPSRQSGVAPVSCSAEYQTPPTYQRRESQLAQEIILLQEFTRARRAQFPLADGQWFFDITHTPFAGWTKQSPYYVCQTTQTANDGTGRRFSAPVVRFLQARQNGFWTSSINAGGIINVGAAFSYRIRCYQSGITTIGFYLVTSIAGMYWALLGQGSGQGPASGLSFTTVNTPGFLLDYPLNFTFSSSGNVRAGLLTAVQPWDGSFGPREFYRGNMIATLSSEEEVSGTIRFPQGSPPFNPFLELHVVTLTNGEANYEFEFGEADPIVAGSNSVNIATIGGVAVTSPLLVAPPGGTQAVNITQTGSVLMTSKNVPVDVLNTVATTPSGTQSVNIAQYNGAPLPGTGIPVDIEGIDGNGLMGPSLPVGGFVVANLTQVNGVPVPGSSGVIPVDVAQVAAVPVPGASGIIPVNVSQVASTAATNPLAVSESGGGGVTQNVRVVGGIADPDIPVWVSDARPAAAQPLPDGSTAASQPPIVYDNAPRPEPAHHENFRADVEAARARNRAMHTLNGNTSLYSLWSDYASTGKSKDGETYWSLLRFKPEEHDYDDLIPRLLVDMPRPVRDFISTVAEMPVQRPVDLKSLGAKQRDNSDLQNRARDQKSAAVAERVTGSTGLTRERQPFRPVRDGQHANHDVQGPAQRIARKAHSLTELAEWLLWECDDVENFGMLVVDLWRKEHIDQWNARRDLSSVCEAQIGRRRLSETARALLLEHDDLLEISQLFSDSWLRWIDQNLPIGPSGGANHGADKAECAARPKRMHAANGNIASKRLCLNVGAEEARAARWNRAMHSLNGNMSGWAQTPDEAAALPSIHSASDGDSAATSNVDRVRMLSEFTGITTTLTPGSSSIPTSLLMRTPYQGFGGANVNSVSEVIPIACAQPIQVRDALPATTLAVSNYGFLNVVRAMVVASPPQTIPSISSLMRGVNEIIARSTGVRPDAKTVMNFSTADANTLIGRITLTTGDSLVTYFMKYMCLFFTLAGAGSTSTKPMGQILFHDALTRAAAGVIVGGFNNSPIVTQQCRTANAGTPYWRMPFERPPGAAQHRIFFHAVARTIPPGGVMLASRTMLGPYVTTNNPQAIYALEAVGLFPYPFGLATWTVPTQGVGVGPIDQQVVMPYSTLFSVTGATDLHVLCQADSATGAPPASQAAAQDYVMFEPSWGPNPPPGEVAYDSINVNYPNIANLVSVDATDFLLSWIGFGPRQLNASDIWRYVQMASTRYGRCGDLQVATELAEVVSNRGVLPLVSALGATDSPPLQTNPALLRTVNWTGLATQQFANVDIGTGDAEISDLLLPDIPADYLSLVNMGLLAIVDDGYPNQISAYNNLQHVTTFSMLGGLMKHCSGEILLRQWRLPADYLNTCMTTNNRFPEVLKMVRGFFLNSTDGNQPLVSESYGAVVAIHQTLWKEKVASCLIGINVFSSWFMSGELGSGWLGPYLPGGLTSLQGCSPTFYPDWVFQFLAKKQFRDMLWTFGAVDRMMGAPVPNGRTLQLPGAGAGQLTTQVPLECAAGVLGTDEIPVYDSTQFYNDNILFATLPEAYAEFPALVTKSGVGIVNMPLAGQVVVHRRISSGQYLDFTNPAMTLYGSYGWRAVIVSTGEFTYLAMPIAAAQRLSQFAAGILPIVGSKWIARGLAPKPSVVFVGGKSVNPYARFKAKAAITEPKSEEKAKPKSEPKTEEGAKDSISVPMTVVNNPIITGATI